MAKRPTIGNNPLDALMPESHLDTVVPDLLTKPKKEKPSLKPAAKEKPQGQVAGEDESQALREEVARLKEQVKELKDRLAQAEPRWVTLRRLGGS